MNNNPQLMLLWEAMFNSMSQQIKQPISFTICPKCKTEFLLSMTQCAKCRNQKERDQWKREWFK